MERQDMIGKTYDDPEGVWEVVRYNDEADDFTVKCIQTGNTWLGMSFGVSAEEVEYYINGEQ